MTPFERGFYEELAKLAQHITPQNNPNPAVPIATQNTWWNLKPQERTWDKLKELRSQETPPPAPAKAPGALKSHFAPASAMKDIKSQVVAKGGQQALKSAPFAVRHPWLGSAFFPQHQQAKGMEYLRGLGTKIAGAKTRRGAAVGGAAGLPVAVLNALAAVRGKSLTGQKLPLTPSRALSYVAGPVILSALGAGIGATVGSALERKNRRGLGGKPKVAFTVDPNLTPQAMAQAPPIDPAFLLAAAPAALGASPAAAEAAGGLVTPENVKAVGGTLMGLLEAQVAPSKQQHVYTSLATPKDVSGFRY